MQDGEGSGSSESSFRELDDVFLQTQTRIWLGEVLHTRLDEQLQIADVLADGELLFEVSRDVREMFLVKSMQLRDVKVYKYEPFSSRKSSGRYLPYSNVDSFLKMCKLLGLSGIDLFSPSDVVEKKDTRKVCMCIRSLSKKARSRHLSVPDFDIVTYTVTMSTDMVGCMRRSWEQSHCSSSNSVTDSSYHKSRQKSRQRKSNSAMVSNSFSEESDDAESSFMFQSDSSITNCFYNSSSSEISLIVQDGSFKQYSLHSCDQNQQKGEYVKYQLEAVFSKKSAGSLGSQHLQNDSQLDDRPSLFSANSNIHSGDGMSHKESAARNSPENITLDPVFVDPNLKDDLSVVGDCDDGHTPIYHIDDQIAWLGNIQKGTYTSDSILLDGEDRIFHDCVNAGSYISEAITKNMKNEFRHRYSDNGDKEVASIASLISASSVVRSLDFDDHLGVGDDLKSIGSLELQNNKITPFNKKYMEWPKFTDMVQCETSEHRLTGDYEVESLPEMKAMDIGFSSKHFLNRQCNAGCAEHVFLCDDEVGMSKIKTNVVCDNWKVFANRSPLPNDSHLWDQKDKCRICTLPIGNDDHGISSVCLSPVASQGEMQNKATGIGFWPTTVKPIIMNTNRKGSDATLVESKPYAGKQPNKCLQTACFDSIKKTYNYEESNAPRNIIAIAQAEKTRTSCCKDDGSCFQHHCNTFASRGLLEIAPEKHTFLPTENSQNVGDNSYEVPMDEKEDLICCAEDKDQGDRKHEKVQILAFEHSTETEDVSLGRAKSKPQRRPLLIVVARGAAVVGVLFLLLHLRKNGGADASELGKQRKGGGRELSLLKRRRGSKVAGEYPAEKLRFGD